MTSSGGELIAALTHLNGKKLSKMALNTEQKANEAIAAIENTELIVDRSDEKIIEEKPLAPYRTSTLQQDAATKLKWNTKRTMSTAQSLYEGRNLSGMILFLSFLQTNAPEASEGGLITYMRTDGVSIGTKSVNKIRNAILQQFGEDYLPKTKKTYRSTVLNAQEAHEAIHPTDILRKPEDLPKSITSDERKLYALIWKRTMASQMNNATHSQVRILFIQVDSFRFQRSVEIEDSQGDMRLRVSARKTLFKGFRKVYITDDENDASETSQKRDFYPILAEIKKGESIRLDHAEKVRHKTAPTPRYTEASIVKAMEEMGIGRPSTFAMITSVLVVDPLKCRGMDRF